MTTATVKFYPGDPRADYPFVSSSGYSIVWSGPAEPTGTATITDTQSGTQGLTLEDQVETATADVSVNGNSSTGTRVNAERSWVVRDTVTGDEFVVVEFNVFSGETTSGDYTLSEKPFVPGRTYDVIEYEASPSTASGEPVFTYANFVCFATGTLIATPAGSRPVEELCEGDLVQTLDRGTQPLLWTGARTLRFPPAPDRQKPVEIKAGAFGHGLPAQTLVLSPQHRLLLEGPGTQVLGPVKGLLSLDHVRKLKGKRQVRYHSLMTPQHEVIFANGLAVESFWPGRYAIGLLPCLQRLRLIAGFPRLLQEPEVAYSPKARSFLNVRETEDAILTRSMHVFAPKRSLSSPRFGSQLRSGISMVSSAQRRYSIPT